MEHKGVITELTETEVVVETAPGEFNRLSKHLFISPQVGQSVYISISDEAAKAPREILNEIIGSNEA
jgi:hypothetical protein